MIVIVHRLATAEFVAARRWYARQSPMTEARFVAAVDVAVQFIASTPAAGAVFHNRYRWVRTRRYPYLLYYEASDANRAFVFAMAHARRRLGYGLRRVQRP